MEQEKKRREPQMAGERKKRQGKKTLFSVRLAERREELGLTQSQLAEKVGTSQQSISAYESMLERRTGIDGKAPNFLMLLNIANALEVSLDWLCGREDYSYNVANDLSLCSIMQQIIQLVETSKTSLVTIREGGASRPALVFDGEINTAVEKFQKVRSLDLGKENYEEQKRLILEQLSRVPPSSGSLAPPPLDISKLLDISKPLEIQFVDDEEYELPF